MQFKSTVTKISRCIKQWAFFGCPMLWLHLNLIRFASYPKGPRRAKKNMEEKVRRNAHITAPARSLDGPTPAFSDNELDPLICYS